MRYALAELVGCDHQRFLASNEIKRQARAGHHYSVLGATGITASDKVSTEIIEKLPTPKFRVQSSAERHTKVELFNSPNYARITFMDTSVSTGSGPLDDDEADSNEHDQGFAMPLDFLHKITPTPSAKLRLITISGDSIPPVLKHGDVVMLDCAQKQPSPPGIYIVDEGVGLVAKRLDLVPATQPQMLKLTSENSVSPIISAALTKLISLVASSGSAEACSARQATA